MDTDIIAVPEGTPVSCNRCGHTFRTTKVNERGKFKSQPVTRLRKFDVCPHCHMNDCHWLQAKTVAPSYDHLLPYLREQAIKIWAVNN